MSPGAEGPDSVDVIVIGGGQAALSVAYFLRRTSLSHLLLDVEDERDGCLGQSGCQSA